MDRKSSLKEAALTFLAPKYQVHLQNIMGYIKNNRELICQEFCQELLPFIESVRQQQLGEKKEIRYVLISSLFSSTITKSYEYQIAFYSEELYLDPVESSFYWCPQYVFDNIEDDIEQFSQSVKEQIVNLRKHELEEIRQMYANDYHIISGIFFKKIIATALKMGGIHNLNLAKDLEIYFGIYMDKVVKIAEIKRDD